MDSKDEAKSISYFMIVPKPRFTSLASEKTVSKKYRMQYACLLISPSQVKFIFSLILKKNCHSLSSFAWKYPGY